MFTFNRTRISVLLLAITMGFQIAATTSVSQEAQSQPGIDQKAPSESIKDRAGRVISAIGRVSYWGSRAVGLGLSSILLLGCTKITLVPDKDVSRSQGLAGSVFCYSIARALYRSLRYGDKDGHGCEKCEASTKK